MSEILIYTSWLYTKVYQNDYFFFDLWSLVHCWNGFVLLVILKSAKVRNPLNILLILLLLYEVVEILIPYFALGIFKPETFKDQFTDIIIGMMGGGIGLTILSYTSMSKPRHVNTLKIFIIFLASITYAFLWVGFYGYSYNIGFFNSIGINWYAWIMWTSGTFLTIYLFTHLKIKIFLLRFSITWVSYLAALLMFEALGYHFFSLHESSNPGSLPLIFELIHGSPVLHFMYIFSPFFSVTLFLGLNYMIFKALKFTRESSPTSGILTYN